MPFRIGLSGLNAASEDLRVTGNNIANAGTTGFKESRAEFADIFAESYGGISRQIIGSGVHLAAVTQQFNQGNLEETQNSLDLGINGNGFFVLNDGGSQVYSRAGAFQVDRNGFVVNSAGQRLQAYLPKTPGSTETQFNVGQLSDMQISLADKDPAATATVDAQLNLAADALPPLNADGTVVDTVDTNDPNTYNYSTSITVYDSLGTPRNMTLYFLKPGDAGPPVTGEPLKWNVYAELDGFEPETPHEPAFIQELTFDSNGALVDPTGGIDMNFTLGDYAPINGATIGPIDPTTGEGNGIITLDLTGTTQYGTKYSVNDLTQDGYTSGRLSSLDIDQTGVVFARYTNGQSEILGQVALADFKNPQGLQQLGDNNWAESYSSGGAIYDSPGNGRLGEIRSGFLEASNVDIAEQLVHLITAQRNFQANAQTITTADTVTQTVINMVK